MVWRVSLTRWRVSDTASGVHISHDVGMANFFTLSDLTEISGPFGKVEQGLL
jgi:hypothetical protein